MTEKPAWPDLTQFLNRFGNRLFGPKQPFEDMLPEDREVLLGELRLILHEVGFAYAAVALSHAAMDTERVGRVFQEAGLQVQAIADAAERLVTLAGSMGDPATGPISLVLVPQTRINELGSSVTTVEVLQTPSAENKDSSRRKPWRRRRTRGKRKS